MVVTYGLMGMLLPSASMIPPTMLASANSTLSETTTRGVDETRIAAAAGVTRSESTSSAPTIWMETAVPSPSRIMNTMESRRTGTPRAAATSGSTLANISGRQTTASPTMTTALIATR